MGPFASDTSSDEPPQVQMHLRPSTQGSPAAREHFHLSPPNEGHPHSPISSIHNEVSQEDDLQQTSHQNTYTKVDNDSRLQSAQEEFQDYLKADTGSRAHYCMINLLPHGQIPRLQCDMKKDWADGEVKALLARYRWDSRPGLWYPQDGKAVVWDRHIHRTILSYQRALKAPSARALWSRIKNDIDGIKLKDVEEAGRVWIEYNLSSLNLEDDTLWPGIANATYPPLVSNLGATKAGTEEQPALARPAYGECSRTLRASRQRSKTSDAPNARVNQHNEIDDNPKESAPPFKKPQDSTAGSKKRAHHNDAALPSIEEDGSSDSNRPLLNTKRLHRHDSPARSLRALSLEEASTVNSNRQLDDQQPHPAQAVNTPALHLPTSISMTDFPTHVIETHDPMFILTNLGPDRPPRAVPLEQYISVRNFLNSIVEKGRFESKTASDVEEVDVTLPWNGQRYSIIDGDVVGWNVLMEDVKVGWRKTDPDSFHGEGRCRINVLVHLVV